MVKLRAILGEAFKDFEALDNIGKVYFALGCELWTENFDALLALVKEYIINLWEARKVKLYGEQRQSQSRLGIRGMALLLGGREMVSLSSVTQGE